MDNISGKIKDYGRVSIISIVMFHTSWQIATTSSMKIPQIIFIIIGLLVCGVSVKVTYWFLKEIKKKYSSTKIEHENV